MSNLVLSYLLLALFNGEVRQQLILETDSIIKVKSTRKFKMFLNNFKSFLKVKIF